MSSAVPFLYTKTMAEANKASVRLFRDAMRSSHHIVKIYGLDVPPSKVEAAIKQAFQKHKGTKDRELVDHLVFKGRLELEETLALFKTKTHVMRYINQSERTPIDKINQPEPYPADVQRFFEQNS